MFQVHEMLHWFDICCNLLSNYHLFAEEVLKEIFERCGTIITIRMSKKNFAHVRFQRECSVDSAIQFSGNYSLLDKNSSS